MKMAIYARYSTEQQDETSIDGQFANCRSLALGHGWTVVDEYRDEAMSGSDDSRPGYIKLLADSESGKFDGIIVDETSRVTRRPGELPRLLDILAFRNQFLIDCKGFDSRSQTAFLLASVYGGIDSLELSKIRDRTHRGLRERAKAGFSAGGRTYGYISAPVDPKDPDSKKNLVIDEEQASIVREIFQRYADFESPRSIADDLNRRGIPSPGSSWKRAKRRARGWTGSAISGSAKTFTGILRRELYIGQQIWNRRKWKKVPGTSKRKSEMRPQSEWVITEHPELRIVDDVVWHKVQSRLRSVRENAHPNNTAPRGRPSRYLLSGIMVCGECGGNYIMHDSRAYGCSSHTNGGKHLCSNKLRVKRETAETAILRNVREQLFDESIVARVTEQIETAVSAIHEAESGHPKELRQSIRALEERIEKVADAIESMGISHTLSARLLKLENERDSALQRLQAATEKQAQIESLPDVVPILVERWRQLVEEIGTISSNPHVRLEEIEGAREQLKTLLGRVELRPRDGILWAYPPSNAEGLAEASPLHIKVVAGAGFEPATFGL